MKHPIRLVLALSASAWFAAGCSNTPYDATADDTTGSSYSSNNIPEAGPLTEAVNTYNPPANNLQPTPQVDTYAYQPQPQYQPAQPQTQPPVDNNSYDTYADNTVYDNSGAVAYDNSANANNTGGASYDYSAPGNDTYSNYATPPSNNTNNYYSGGNTAAPANTYTGGGGGAAVQVFASGSSSKAEQIKNAMSGRGLPAVVDNVAGLYKVRVPFGSEGEARANLARVRSASGEPGAFVTFR